MPVEQTYPELSDLRSEKVLFIDCYHGLYELPDKVYDYVIYTSFGEAFNDHQIHKLLTDFKDSFIIIVTARRYPRIPKETDRYKIITIPSAYSWYASKMPHDYINVRARTFEKRFLSLNNRAQWNRQALAQFMMQFKLLDKSYFSYHCKDIYQIGQREVYNQTNSQYGKHWFNRFIDDDVFFDMLPIKTGLDNFGDNDWTPGNVEYYNNSFCSIVTETYTEENYDSFFTEKTMKPFAYGHPFLLYSSSHALEALKNIGFHTFDGLLDESYDKITDRMTRFEAVLHEILRINTLSDNEIADLYTKMLPTIDHNLNYFWNLLPQKYSQEIQVVKQQIADIVLR